MQRLSDHPPDGVPAAALTERQREIVALVAEGMTNQAIADRLGLTRVTVSEHVATILWRLGLTSRGEIAVWAIGQDRPAHGRSTERTGHGRRWVAVCPVPGCAPGRAPHARNLPAPVDRAFPQPVRAWGALYHAPVVEQVAAVPRRENDSACGTG